jgi:hypothetical protein
MQAHPDDQDTVGADTIEFALRKKVAAARPVSKVMPTLESAVELAPAPSRPLGQGKSSPYGRAKRPFDSTAQCRRLRVQPLQLGLEQRKPRPDGRSRALC